MSKALIAFDYDGIDKDAKGKLIALAGQVKRHEKDFIAAGMEIGEAISEAHKLLAGTGRDGKFKQWIELETGLSRTSAYDWMHAYERARKCPILDTLPATVAITLAAPAVSDEVIKDFEKQIDKGVKPTVAAAKATIDRFREVNDKPKGKGKTSAPKTAKPAEDKPPQDEPIPTPVAETTAVGPCPKGGEHELDDERICMKCHEHDPELELRRLEHNRAVEAFAKSLMAAFELAPDDPWLDEARLNIAKDQIKGACATIRLAKAHDKPCPKCNGAGCKTCRKCGYLPKQSYEMAGGK